MSNSSDTGPKRESLAALALIRREEAGQTLYLTQWNLNWRALNLIGGHKHASESFRECLVREIREELGLAIGEDFRLTDQPPTRLAFDAFSESGWQQTSYVIELFSVELSGDLALAKVDANADNRWVSRSEFLAGRCVDGTRVSPTVARIVMSLAEKA